MSPGRFTHGGPVRHRPRWQRIILVVGGLLIVFSGYVISVPEVVISYGFPVESLTVLPTLLRVVSGIVLVLLGALVMMLGFFT